jgi:cell division protein FtsZ
MLDSPFLGGPSRLKKAEAVFISLTGGKDLNIGEAKKTVETVESFTSEKAKLVIGVNTDELYGDKVRLTVICTEFDEPESVERDNEPTPSPVTRHRKIQPLIFNGDEKTSEYEQQELPLVPVSKGIFLNATPTMNNGEDLDLPTFQRKNITIDSGD